MRVLATYGNGIGEIWKETPSKGPKGDRSWKCYFLNITDTDGEDTRNKAFTEDRLLGGNIAVLAYLNLRGNFLLNILYCCENWNIEAMDKALFLLILTTLLACISASDVQVSMASVILEEGQTGNIFCNVNGIGSYYWRKGNSFDNSTEVAYIISGVPSAGDGSYSVNENGTLFIRSVVLEDEGKYFCRVASEETDCYGEVMIYVQASLPNFVIGIDRCYTKHSCSVLIDSSQSASLTCIARNASCSMILKWFNGSTEITNHIRKNSSIVQGVREISSTLDVAHGKKGSLTCQAVEPKGRNDNGRFANVQLEMPEVPVVTDDNRLGSVAVALITSGACLILFVILLLVKDRLTRRKRKSKDKVQGEELKSLMVKEDNNEKRIMEQKEEISRLRVKEGSNGTQITELKEEISRLKKTKENKEEQIMKENKEISRLKTKEEYNEKQIKEQKEEISKLRVKENNNGKQITELTEEISSLRAKEEYNEKQITEQKEEISKLRVKVENNGKQITVQKEKISSLRAKEDNNEKQITEQKEEISRLKTTKENKEEQIMKEGKEISRLTTTKENKEEQITKQDKEISRLKGIVVNRDREIAEMKAKMENNERQIIRQKEQISNFKVKEENNETQITELKGEISSLRTTKETKDKGISGLKIKTKNNERQIGKQEEEISNLKGKIVNRDREIAEMKAQMENNERQIGKQEEEISNLKMIKAKKEEQIMNEGKEISRLKMTEANKEEQIMKKDKEISRLKADIESKMYEVAEPEELKRKTPKKPKLSVEEPQQKVEEPQQKVEEPQQKVGELQQMDDAMDFESGSQ
ncbi:uncharacterized protein [Apostichopus japonicus]|uniref:uncharacterized protein isoform X15 n=1 Tax=Stichopus japonicus TaxID=307972 RepID=UPI003AB87A88